MRFAHALTMHKILPLTDFLEMKIVELFSPFCTHAYHNLIRSIKRFTQKTLLGFPKQPYCDRDDDD